MSKVLESTPAENVPAQAELTLEQELEAFAATTAPAKVEPATEAPTTPAPETVPEQTIDQQLEAIKEPEVPPAPQLTEEQQQILKIIPSAQAAQAMSEQINGFNAFTGAFTRGDFQAVETMFQNWNPEAYGQFLDHVYKQKVGSGEWVDRWIAEKEGNTAVHQGMRSIQKEVNDLKLERQRQQSERQSQEREAQMQRVAQSYVSHLDGLFDQIKFSPADRRWVMADIHSKVAADMNVRAAINAGNPAAVNGIFKAAVREYSTRDQAASAAKQAELKAQELKKPLLTTSPVTQLGALPSDINQVPKGREEEWMEQELNSLFAKGKK